VVVPRLEQDTYAEVILRLAPRCPSFKRAGEGGEALEGARRVQPRRRPLPDVFVADRREVASADHMAVENDYNLLVHNLNELERTISKLRDEVGARRLREAGERLEPNETDWVNLIAFQLRTVAHIFEG
jgi:hypothetical protein